MKYESITESIVKDLHPTAEPINRQKKGSCADYIIDSTYCLEVKLDFIANKTNNIFIEYANEKNGVSTDSGIALSAKWEYQVLYIVMESFNKYRAYQIPAVKLLELGQTYGKQTKTRPRINGNAIGFHGLGYKLNIEHMEGYRIK